MFLRSTGNWSDILQTGIPSTFFVLVLCSFYSLQAHLLRAEDQKATTEKSSDSKNVEGTKWALLIGVDQYLDNRLGGLRYCGADAQALRDVLVRQGGFPADQVLLLHGGQTDPKRQPLRIAVENSVDALLSQAGPQDLVLVSFSGHGVQVGKTAYLCTTDADLDRPEATMVSVDELYNKLSQHCRAAQKIVFVDACRKPVESGQKAPTLELSKGFADRLRQVPEGVLILSSCRSGQLSYEEQDFGHGIFVHFLLDGLNGKADSRGPNLRGNGDGRIDVDELFNYASTETGKYVMNKFVETQTPELYGVRRGPIDLLPALPDVKEILEKALQVARTMGDESDSALAITRIAAVRIKSGESEGARNLFGEALRMAASINEADLSDRSRSSKAAVLKTIVFAQGAIKDKHSAEEVLDQILQIVRRIEDKSLKVKLLNTISIEQAKMGNKSSGELLLSEALLTAGSMDNKMLSSGRDSVLSEIAKERSESNDFTVALEAAQAIYDANWSVFTLSNISASLAARGEIAAAKNTIQEALAVARDPSRYTKEGSAFRAYAWIALAQARSGFSDDASETINKELIPRWSAVSELSSGRSATAEFCRAQFDNNAAMTVYDQALKITSKTDRVMVLLCLADAIKKSEKRVGPNRPDDHDFIHDKRKWVTDDGFLGMNFLTEHSFGLDDLTGLWFSESQKTNTSSSVNHPELKHQLPSIEMILDEARRTAALISGEYGESTRLMIEVATAQNSYGSKDGALRTLADAEHSVELIDDEEEREDCLSRIQFCRMIIAADIACEKAREGDFLSAISMARSLNSVDSNVEQAMCALTLTRIASIQSKSGEHSASEKAIRESISIAESCRLGDDDIEGELAFVFAVIIQSKKGFGEDALRTLKVTLLPRWPKTGVDLSTVDHLVAEFCREQVKHGTAVQTYELIHNIPSPFDQVVVYTCLAEAILEEQRPLSGKQLLESSVLSK